MRVNMTHYVSYRMFFDRLIEQQAEAVFWAQVENQGSDMENSDNEATVWIKDNQRATESTSRKTTHITDVDNEATTTTTTGDSCLATPSSMRKRRCQHADDMDDDDDDALDHDGDGTNDMLDPPTRRSFSCKKAADNKANLADHTARKRAKSAAPTYASTPDAGAKRQVDMRMMKNDLKKDVLKACADAAGPKSVYTILDKKMKGCDTSKLQLLDLDGAKILSDMKEKLIDPLETMRLNMQSLPLKGVEKTKNDLNQLLADMPTLVGLAQEIVEAIKFFHKEDAKETKKVTMAKKYVVERLCKNLMIGDWGKETSKVVSGTVAKLRSDENDGPPPNLVKFDCTDADFIHTRVTTRRLEEARRRDDWFGGLLAGRRRCSMGALLEALGLALRC